MRALRVCSSLSLVVLGACAHPSAPTCKAPAPASPCAAPRSPAWVDKHFADDTTPLALYDVTWVLMTGDSGALITLPADLHTFTLGSWECALSQEQTSDSLSEGSLAVARKRRLVCTHGSGLTMQTDLACGYHAPSPVTEGAPAGMGRSTRIALGDAPSLTLSCELHRVERLRVLGPGRVPANEACIEDTSVISCPAIP